MRQALFTFPPAQDFSRENIIRSGSNREALAWLDAWPNWPSRALWLHGAAGAGKTHLAHLWAEEHGAALIDPVRLGTQSSEAILQGRAHGAIDGVEAVAHEAGLFHLINHLRESGGTLLLTAREPAAAMAFALPDLASRLQAMPSVFIAPPDDALLSALLVKLLHDRQLRVAPDVVDYLLPRLERSFDAVRALVERLDREAMREHKNITVPFARQVLEEASL